MSSCVIFLVSFSSPRKRQSGKILKKRQNSTALPDGQKPKKWPSKKVDALKMSSTKNVKGG